MSQSFQTVTQALVIYCRPVGNHRSRRMGAHELHPGLQIAAILIPGQRRDTQFRKALQDRRPGRLGRHLPQRALLDLKLEQSCTRRARTACSRSSHSTSSVTRSVRRKYSSRSARDNGAARVMRASRSRSSASMATMNSRCARVCGCANCAPRPVGQQIPVVTAGTLARDAIRIGAGQQHAFHAGIGMRRSQQVTDARGPWPRRRARCSAPRSRPAGSDSPCNSDSRERISASPKPPPARNRSRSESSAARSAASGTQRNWRAATIICARRGCSGSRAISRPWAVTRPCSSNASRRRSRSRALARGGGRAGDPATSALRRRAPPRPLVPMRGPRDRSVGSQVLRTLRASAARPHSSPDNILRPRDDRPGLAVDRPRRVKCVRCQAAPYP